MTITTINNFRNDYHICISLGVMDLYKEAVASNPNFAMPLAHAYGILAGAFKKFINYKSSKDDIRLMRSYFKDLSICPENAIEIATAFKLLLKHDIFFLENYQDTLVLKSPLCWRQAEILVNLYTINKDYPEKFYQKLSFLIVLENADSVLACLSEIIKYFYQYHLCTDQSLFLLFDKATSNPNSLITFSNYLTCDFSLNENCMLEVQNFLLSQGSVFEERKTGSYPDAFFNKRMLDFNDPVEYKKQESISDNLIEDDFFNSDDSLSTQLTI